MLQTHTHIKNFYPCYYNYGSALLKLGIDIHNILKLQKKKGQELDDLKTEVSETKGIMQSAKVLLQGAKDKPSGMTLAQDQTNWPRLLLIIRLQGKWVAP